MTNSYSKAPFGGWGLMPYILFALYLGYHFFIERPASVKKVNEAITLSREATQSQKNQEVLLKSIIAENTIMANTVSELIAGQEIAVIQIQELDSTSKARTDSSHRALLRRVEKLKYQLTH